MVYVYFMFIEELEIDLDVVFRIFIIVKVGEDVYVFISFKGRFLFIVIWRKDEKNFGSDVRYSI